MRRVSSWRRGGAGRSINRLAVIGLSVAVVPVVVLTTPAAGAASWSGPEAVSQTGPQPSPVAAATSSGAVAGYWQSSSHSWVYRRQDAPSGPWGSEQTIATDALGPPSGVLALAGSPVPQDSLVYAVVAIAGSPNYLRYVEHDGAAATRTFILGPGDISSVAVDSSRSAFVVATSVAGILAWRIPQNGQPTGPSVLAVRSPSVSYGAPQVAIGPNGPLAIWTRCSTGPGPGYLRTCQFQQSSFGNGNWSVAAPVTAPGNPQFYTVGSGGGRLVVGYNQNDLVTNTTNYDSNVRAITYANGAWSSGELVSATAGGINRVPTVAVASNGDAGLLLPNQKFFTQSLGGAWQAGPDFPVFTNCGTGGADALPLVVEGQQLLGFAARTNPGSCNPSQVVGYRYGSGVSPSTSSSSSSSTSSSSSSSTSSTRPPTTTTTTTAPPPPTNSVFTSLNSRKVMDVPGNSQFAGVQLDQWPWNGGANQKWQIQSVGSNVFKIVSVGSGLVLDVAGGSTADGAKIVQWPWNGGANQRWLLSAIPGNPNAVLIISAASGKVVDVANASLADGAPLVLFAWHGALNQIWARTNL